MIFDFGAWVFGLLGKVENTQETLHQLLHDRCLYPEHAAEIDAQIYATFSATRAVMVMDMSGFSRTTVRYGVVHFLTMIQRMNELARPCVEEQGGMVVKFLADNVFAVFPEVIPAMRAAHDLAQCLRDASEALPPEMKLAGKFGIGYGEILLIENQDIFGSEVNLASKLGEDIALPNEILLTEAARTQLSEYQPGLESRALLISGLKLRYYSVHSV